VTIHVKKTRSLPIRSAFLLCILLACSMPVHADGTWLGTAWRFRVPVTISVGTYERLDMPAEVQLNFTQFMSAFGFSGTLVESSLRVVEVNGSGTIIDTAVAFQFDKDSDYNASTKASGKLVLIAGGVTTAGTTRTYHVYFHGGSGSFQPAQVTPKVVLTDNVSDAGQLSYRVQATGSTYYYHKQGAGFSSWIDANGNDWLSYAPGGGSAGEYRGIPNAVYPEGHFHPGKTSATSDLVHTGPVKATIHSITTDGKWECQWEIYPRFARMTMLKRDHGYWFLYEGTPGGTIQPATDFMVRSNGTQTVLSTSWTADLSTDEWAYFSDPNVVAGGRSLFMVHEEDDAALDSYWTMENNMTVFGFGRNNAPTEALINNVPQHLTIGLMDGTQFTQCSKIINGAYRPMAVAAGSPEQQQVPAPQALLPAHGATGLPSSVQLSWTRVAGTSSYRVQAGRDSTFTSAIILDDSTITDTTALLGSLRPGALHYWRVRATVSGVAGPWTPTRNFSTALPVPVLSDPPNGASIATLTPTLRWRSVQWATAYRLQVSSDSTFAGGFVVNEWNSGDTLRVLPALNEATTYFWRVAARTSDVTGSFSGQWRFSTYQMLVAPTALQPSNGATGLSTIEVFKWTRVQGAITYRLQVATDSTFAGGFVKNDSTIVDTVRTVVGLARGTRYYWRVQARLASGYTPFSPVWWFQTVYQLPGQPLLVSPSGGAHIATDSASFVWTSVQPGVTRYWLEVGLDSLFAFSLVDSTVVDTTSKVDIMVRSKWYWWRVRGGNAGGWGPFSAVQVFYADEVTGLRRENDLPTQLSLDQNFPNPFNPSTRIRFALPAEKQVRIEVYSVLGERTATLVNDRLPAGVYTVEVDGTRMASGVYYYRLVSPETSITRKMLLVK